MGYIKVASIKVKGFNGKVTLDTSHYRYTIKKGNKVIGETRCRSFAIDMLNTVFCDYLKNKSN